ncbi:hypothetical protein [Kitasatospora kifunensis]|uniref:Uncharacterized protein n=1 Tax=Kitasatospora kifunensis TaxID=58351 RepID=A0A7W7R412_KITKI|nr:hypothetical protein [Kitasatospora kifunensis]MBB4924784.1 hypothetical protein [Kitasatospora kifunensis]
MNPLPHQPITPVIGYTADGQPFYLTPPTPTAQLIPYQPAPMPIPATSHPPAPAQQALLQPYAPAAVPGRDPWPARLLAGGLGIGGAGIGIGFAAQALAAATTAVALITAALGLLYLLKNGAGGASRGAVNVHVNVTNRNR